MNQQLIKMLKAGIFAGALSAVIEIVISTVMTKFLGNTVDSVQLVLGGLTIGVIASVLTIIISFVIAKRKQRF